MPVKPIKKGLYSSMMDSNYLQAFKETKRYFKTNIFPLKLIPASSDKKIIFIQLQTKCN